MNKILSFVFFLSILCNTIAISASSENYYTVIPQNFSKSESEENEELNQQELFNTTRKGVVAIKVTAHLILEKYVNEKLWYGTGFVVNTNPGLIVTNAHVAGEMAVCTYEVKFGNGKTVEAKLLYIDPLYDFAILSVDPKDIPIYVKPLKISEESPIINSKIYAMGNSSKNEFSTYQGYIFDTESILWLKPFAEQSFQFSGLTVPGASGSPVFNTKGEVIGLLYGGKLVSGAALPISYVKPAIDKLKNGENFHRYFYGAILNYMPIQNAIDSGNIPESIENEYETCFPNSNNKILYVHKKLTAFNNENSQLDSGDIIWKVEDEIIGSNLKKIDQIVQEKAGKNLNITVYRKGKKIDLEIPTFELDCSAKLKLLSFAGTTFFETTPEVKVNFGKNNTAVYITDSEAGSPFMEISNPSNGTYQGGAFQITEIAGKKISTLDELIDIIPDLFKKKVFDVKFIKLGSDSGEYSITTKYFPEFVDATLYTFNTSENKWEVKSIKNPKQNNF